MARRRRKKDKPADAIAGFIIAILGLVWLSTFDTALVIKLFNYVIVIIIGVGIFLFLRRRRMLLTSGIAEIDKMSGTTFEQLLLEYFRKLGYKGKTTEEYGDYGADLLLAKDNIKYVVQAKRWNRKVDIKAVQEIVAAIKHYKADRGIVITNNFFTRNAENLARSNNIELWDRNKLINLMSRVQGQSLVEELSVANDTSVSDFICPRCGNELVLRSGSHGKFYGCRGFPKCRYTQNFC